MSWNALYSGNDGILLSHKFCAILLVDWFHGIFYKLDYFAVFLPYFRNFNTFSHIPCSPRYDTVFILEKMVHCWKKTFSKTDLHYCCKCILSKKKKKKKKGKKNFMSSYVYCRKRFRPMLAFLEEIWNKWVVAVEKSPKGQKKKNGLCCKGCWCYTIFLFFLLRYLNKL